MSADTTRHCPSDETLASYVEGTVDAKTRRLVLAHIETCSDCMAAVLSANEYVDAQPGREHGRSSSSRWWLAAAAAVLIALVAVPLLRRRDTPVARLVALAPRSARAVEPRLSGGFPWAAYAGTERVTSVNTDSARMKLTGVAGELVERAGRDDSADAQHAAALAMLLIDVPADAIPRLEAATRNTNDARMWSDLAAARYATASRLGRASLYPQALTAADAALRADPKLPEALFNRALILERLGLTDQAKQAWERYLEADPSSPWSSEARARLAGLPATTRSYRFEHDRPLLEQAAERGDTAAVRRYVDAHRDRARAYAEAEYLGHWGEAVQRRDPVAAARWLSIARHIGDALVDLSGETLAREAVRSIDDASATSRPVIAAAHIAYRAGRIAYSRKELDAAQRELLRAAELFDSAGDPMAIAARYYGAGVQLAGDRIAEARAGLERARAEAAGHPEFINLGAHVRWELGRADMLADDWSAAIPVLAEGAAMFRRSGERGSEAFVEGLLARALVSLGRADDAWQARMRAFAALSADGEYGLLASSIDGAVHAELLAGRGEAALALASLELTAAAAVPTRPQLLLDALVTQAMLQSLAGRSGDALHSVGQAAAIARGTLDPALRMRQLADVAAARGATIAKTDPRGAVAPLTQAIDFYRRHQLSTLLPAPLLLRARCAVRTGDAAAAMRDLEEGIAIVEWPGRDQEQHAPGMHVLNAEHALFTDAIALNLERADAGCNECNGAAFTFAERLRGASLTLAELQRRLAGSGVAVLELVVLPGELVTFAVTEEDAMVRRRAHTAEALAALATASLTEAGTSAAAALYEDVIVPVEPLFVRTRQLIIVPDPRLPSVPFAALYDARTGRYLIERYAVSIASSAASLQRVAPGDPPSLTAIALPSGAGTGVAGLPDAEREIGEVAALYRQARTIAAAGATLGAIRNAAAGAGVLHVAGHTETQPGGGEHALLVAGNVDRGIERMSWKTVLASPRMHAGVVVLAACETLRPPSSSTTRAMSLGEAFSSAGALDVLGTLAPIGDRDARLLFAAFHRQIASGARPADALQDAQRQAIAAEPRNGGRRAWRAVALLTRRIPRPSDRRVS